MAWQRLAHGLPFLKASPVMKIRSLLVPPGMGIAVGGCLPPPQSAFWQRWARWGLALGCGAMVSWVGISRPVAAADDVYVIFGAFERSLSVDDLEDYALTGNSSRRLNAYLSYLNPKQREQLRSLLTTRANLDAVAVSQFLYSDQGEVLLEEVSRVIRTNAPESSPVALRAALILAADSEEGLTPLNILRYFPLAELRIDLDVTLRLVNDIETLINQTSQAIRIIQAQATLEAEMRPHGYVADVISPRMPGPYGWHRLTFDFTDEERDRSFQVDVYAPSTGTAQLPPTPAPVIVISHGLGSDRTTFSYLADYLATHGFVVAVIEHPGSNADQLQALISGRANEVTSPQEFIDRPLDVHFLLDQLAELNESHPDLRGRLDVNQTGVIGQSLGGYTALTLVGGELNSYQLTQSCEGNTIINLSLLLQCRALELSSLDFSHSLSDSRIKAAIAINPIGSGIIGPAGFNRIEHPVMVITGNADTIAPALPEQIRPFTWLGSPDKYLVLMQGGTHFSTLGATTEGSEVVSLPSSIVGPNPAIAQAYTNTLSVAFFQRYLNNDPAYTTFLQSAYAEEISRNSLPLSLVQSLDPIQLTRILASSNR